MLKRIIALSVVLATVVTAFAEEAISSPSQTEGELSAKFNHMYEARDLDGLCSLYYTNGAPDTYLVLVRRLFQEHLRRGRPIDNISIGEIPQDFLDEIAKAKPSPYGDLACDLEPEKLLTVLFKGGSEISAFKTLLGRKDGVWYFVLSFKKKNSS